jgi:endoglucanase
MLSRILTVASLMVVSLGCAAPVETADSPGSPNNAKADGGGSTSSGTDASVPNSVDGSVAQDSGNTPIAPDAGPQPSSAWLSTSGNHIYLGKSVWHGRGANLHDPRSCDACAGAPNAAEVNRRMDELVGWGANFIRLVLESSTLAQTVSQNATYLSQIQSIVAHAAAKPGVYVMVSLWVDPTFTSMGWASNPATISEWKTLATAFAKEPRVLFGLVNEPQSNYDHSLDGQVWTSMNDTVAAIRAAEIAAGGQAHVVAVQGTGGWARFLDYYVTHPITAGNGQNIAYEVHVYDPPSTFAARFENPSKTLPVIIGEFGPAQGYMTLADSQALMTDAMKLEIPHLAWTFHMRCPPNLLVDNSNGGCGVNMALTPSPSWGVPFKAQLSQPW